jgi:hypothetical protein
MPGSPVRLREAGGVSCWGVRPLQPCPGSSFPYAPNMPKIAVPVAAKRRGRPPGEKFPVIVQVRLSEEQAAEFDAWRERQFRHPTRSEAMRQLVANTKSHRA